MNEKQYRENEPEYLKQLAEAVYPDLVGKVDLENGKQLIRVETPTKGMISGFVGVPEDFLRDDVEWCFASTICCGGTAQRYEPEQDDRQSWKLLEWYIENGGQEMLLSMIPAKMKLALILASLRLLGVASIEPEIPDGCPVIASYVDQDPDLASGSLDTYHTYYNKEELVCADHVEIDYHRVGHIIPWDCNEHCPINGRLMVTYRDDIQTYHETDFAENIDWGRVKSYVIWPEIKD